MSQSNSPNYKKNHPSDLTKCQPSLSELHKSLRYRGCEGCNLGAQPDLEGPVLMRGNPDSKILFIGEAPGKTEDHEGEPFKGPAGKLFDKMLAKLDLNPDHDCLIINSCLCRPIAPLGSGKQNVAPTKEQKDACRPYANYVIAQMQPELVVLVGFQAAGSFLADHVKSDTRMGNIAGKLFFDSHYPGLPFFVLIHPAALIYNKAPGKAEQLKQKVKDDLALLKDLVQELLHPESI